jgi:serine/threonine protein kinase
MAHLDRAGPSGPRGAGIRSPRAEVVDISNVRTRTFSPLRRLGDYELLRKIGSGGMAEVWMGRRAAMAGASKAVAIKLLAREVLDDPTYRTMFLEEARLSMLLTNSNVVQVFDVGEINGECFMVMEWVDGLNLSELTQKLGREGERLSVVVAAHVIGEVLRALAYAHGLHHDGAQATIVHRDVSPHNVLVSISGEVKLADFGVARLAREETSGLHVKGKLRYMAPEQLRGRSREPTVDLYAVGAVFHELLEGQRFRSTRDEGDLYALVLSGDYPPLTASVPPELDHLRSRLLDPDPKRRIQTADEALELLAMWPGYRNSSVELGKLIRRWVGVGAPRSGIVSSESLLGGGGQAMPGPRAPSGPAAGSSGPSAVSVAATTPANPTNPPAGDSEAATAVEASRPEPPAREGNPSQPDRGVTLTRTASVGLDEPETLPTSIIAAEPSPRSSAPSMLIVVALTLAISFGVFGLGFPLGWWGGAGGSTVAAAPETSTSGPAEPVEPPKPAGTTGPIETTTGPTTTTTTATATSTSDTGDSQDAIGDDGSSEGTDEGETEDPPPPPPDLPVIKKVEKVRPASVEFLASGFTFVYVLVDGKQLTLEPRGALKLKPGSHVVKFRVDDAEPWKTAKTKIEVESGKSYRVKMKQPSDLTIEKL